ncbi:MAG: hypothetical protein K2N34_10205 [Lachnospiraceae bacterium]|nr:hypothetical protein [Lachnospiraceae bacterium]
MIAVQFHLDFKGMTGDPTRTLAPDYKFSDGSSITVLKGYVYNQANGYNAVPIQVLDIDVKVIDGKKIGDISIMLPQNQKFDVVFLGTSINHNAQTSKLHYNITDRTLSVNYNIINGNDEELDCFFASRTIVTTAHVDAKTIELTRPFAQLNIGTLDYEEYNATTPVKDIAVKVSSIYNKVNLMTGDIVGEPLDVSFKSSTVPSDQLYPIEGFSYLAMNYLLVDQRKLVNVDIIVNHTNSSTSSKTINIPKVAVERNYQTNVYGKTLLTKELPTE